MQNRSFNQRAVKWLATLAFVSVSVAAIAQTDPTLNQVYEAVQAGRLEQANTMMQQVLISHPNSAKAHFVQAEISAKQGQLGRARDALATAEKLAPGLPFANAESVQHLRTQLSAKSTATASPSAGKVADRPSGYAAPVAPAQPFPWTMAIGLGGLAAAVGLFMFRRKSAASAATARAGSMPVNPNNAQAAYGGNPGSQAAAGGGLGGPQNFGAPGPMGSGFGQGGGTGMGGRVMGGLATGLAVGAGVMAAQAIGKSMMGGNEHSQQAGEGLAHNDLIPIDTNQDSGGQNFGVNDSSSWDDGGSLASNDDNDSWDT